MEKIMTGIKLKSIVGDTIAKPRIRSEMNNNKILKIVSL
jgi:hypothetical protein